MSMQNLPTYLDSVFELSRLTCVYPPPFEHLAYGSKSYSIANLDAIAIYKTATFRPASRSVAADSDETPQLGVVKRSWSSCGIHVHLPDNRGYIRGWAMGEVEKSFKPYWIWQEFNPLLRDHRFGVIRVYLVAGDVVHAILTTQNGKGQWDSELVTGMIPLDLVSSG